MKYNYRMKPQDHRLAAIVFTNIVGFSKLMESNEQEVLKFLAFYSEMVNGLANDNRGHIIKTIGDAFLIDFPTALDAVRCSLSVQERMWHYQQGKQLQIQLRIGIHLGDIYYFDNDAMGEGINIASRLQALCEPGMIIISQEVYNQVSGKLQFVSKEMGLVRLKNITREIVAYKIIPKGNAAPNESDASKPDSTIEENSQQTGSRWKTIWNDITGLVASEIEKEITKHKNKTVSKWSSQKSGAWFQHYKERKLKEIEETKNLAGILGHGVTFVVINTFLIWLNSTVSRFPWSGIVFLAWGIGFFSHLGSALGQNSSKKILEKIEDLNEEDGRWLKKSLEKNESLLPSFTATLMISALQLYIQSVTSGFQIFPWSILVSFILGVGFVGNFFSWMANRKPLQEFLQRFGGETSRNVVGQQVQSEPLKKFQVYERKIRRSLKSINPRLHPWSKDVEQVLNQYLVQIGKLSRAEMAIKDILENLPLADLDDEQQKIQQRLESVNSEQLKKEYSRSLELIGKQKRSRIDLEEQHELIKVKLETCEKSLQQIQLDLARVLTQNETDPPESLQSLRKRSDELGNYLIDFSESWKELES